MYSNLHSLESNNAMHEGLLFAGCTDEDVLQTWTSPCTAERHWKLFVLKAYQQSPHLAVQLMERYPGNEFVAKEVATLVRQHPLSFIGISKALSVSDSNVATTTDAQSLR